MNVALPDLTRAELDVMNVLWDRHPMSAREVHDVLHARLEWAYTTTRTMIDRLVGKGALRRKHVHGLSVYEPSVSRAQGLARLVADFAQRVARIPAAHVVPLFAEGEHLTDDELRELRALLKRLEKERA